MNAEKKKYITPSTDVILTAPYVLSAFSGNVIHDDNTQKGRPGPGTGGDEEHSGGDDDHYTTMEKENMSPWHDLDKEQPPFDTVVMVVLPIPYYNGHNYAITSAVCPSPANRDPHAYYDKYGFEELLYTPIAWAYKPDFPKWLTDKILITAK